MPKEAKIELEIDGKTYQAKSGSPTEEQFYEAIALKDGQIKSLSSLMAMVLHITGETMGGGNKAKDRCMECGPRNAHPGCKCVCHEARKYLTELTLG